MTLRIILYGFGFNWIQTRGQPAPTKEAPVLVVSPHSSILDVVIISLYEVPTCVARADIRNIPIFGSKDKMRRVRMVERENAGRVEKKNEKDGQRKTRKEWFAIK